MSRLSAMPHKRRRRTRAEMEHIRETLVTLACDNAPVTSRQLLYLAVSDGVIEKTEAEYKQTVVRLALELRQHGEIAWEDVVDRTRWYFKPKTYRSWMDALRETERLYRQSLWTHAPRLVQVWCESMSVAGIIDQVTDEWDVALYPGKGYSSHDFLRTAARHIAVSGKPTTIYLLGDFDPSGRDIIRFVTKMLHHYAAEVNPKVEIDFETVAVTEAQIIAWKLPGHPAKKTDSRYQSYGIDHAVELEAIPPASLRSLVQQCITQHLDQDEVQRLERIADEQRATLRKIVEGGFKP
jgi:hypothetical protein